MKYIWCNIKNFFKHKKLIFILTVFSVICSCIMIHFSYGLYQNYQLKKEYDLSDEREIALSLQGDFDEESDKELNDDERAEVLELAAINMAKIHELGLELTIRDNCFFGLAAEEYKRNGNGWYDYIMNKADQSVKDAFNEYL